MATSIHIAVTGSKQVLVETRGGKTRMQPGSQHTFVLVDGGEVNVREIGAPLAEPDLPLVRPYYDEEVAEATAPA